MGAFAGNVAVGKELAGLGVEKLHAFLFDELALVVEVAEELGGCLVVYIRCGSGIYIERDTQALE